MRQSVGLVTDCRPLTYIEQIRIRPKIILYEGFPTGNSDFERRHYTSMISADFLSAISLTLASYCLVRV